MYNKFIQLRNFTRFLGLNPIISRFISRNKKYEEEFDEYLVKKLKAGYNVFDIGANVGHYSNIFANIVGDAGLVVAFEPSVRNFEKLEENTNWNEKIICKNIALGASVSRVFLTQGLDDIGATSQVAFSESGAGNWIDVTTVDTLVQEFGCPNAIKIDVEGFEIEILKGCTKTINNPKVQVIGIEIHSRILAKSGCKNPTAIIESFFAESDFKLMYTDFSHIIAYR
jgi:FkbM family methyltransferase